MSEATPGFTELVKASQARSLGRHLSNDHVVLKAKVKFDPAVAGGDAQTALAGALTALPGGSALELPDGTRVQAQGNGKSRKYKIVQPASKAREARQAAGEAKKKLRELKSTKTDVLSRAKKGEHVAGELQQVEDQEDQLQQTIDQAGGSGAEPITSASEAAAAALGLNQTDTSADATDAAPADSSAGGVPTPSPDALSSYAQQGRQALGL